MFDKIYGGPDDDGTTMTIHITTYIDKPDTMENFEELFLIENELKTDLWDYYISCIDNVRVVITPGGYGMTVIVDWRMSGYIPDIKHDNIFRIINLQREKERLINGNGRIDFCCTYSNLFTLQNTKEM